MLISLDVKISFRDTDKMDKVDTIIAQWLSIKPSLDVSGMEVVGRFSRLADHHRLAMEETFKKHGLNGPSFDVLATLRRSNDANALTPGDLMASMMITSGTTTNRIDRLVAQGLVERKADEQDARKTWVCLTAAGRSKVDAAVLDHVETQKGLLAGLSNTEAVQLNNLLRKMMVAKSSAGVG